MTSTWRLLALTILIGVFGTSPAQAQAQSPVYSGQTVIVQPAPIVTGQSYVVPTRRVFRSERRTTMRPTYQGRQPLSFAPYSDRYNTRVLSPQPTYYYPVAPR